MKKMLLVYCVVISGLILSCSKNKGEDTGGPGTDPNPNPGQELPEGVLRKAGTPVPGTLLQKEIGTQGGEIVLGKVKFVFPAGALDKPVTFKVQQLLNTAPNGIDSLAWRFETTADIQTSKPVKMVYTFPRDEEGKPFVPGGDPKALGGVAFHKTEKGSTTGVYNKLPGKPVIDNAAGTATQDFIMRISNGKLDIVNFLKYKLWINRKDGDTVSSTTVVCDDELDYRVTKLGIDDIDDDLVVPLTSEIPVASKEKSFISMIYINGVPMGTGTSFGIIRSNQGENYFTYQAPRIVPGGPEKTSQSFAISIELTTIKSDVSKYYLVSNVKLINETSINIKGRNVVNMRASANEEAGRKHINISFSNYDHSGVVADGYIEINDVFAGIGNYEMKYPANLNVGASAVNDDASWGTATPDPQTNGLSQYGTGSVSITTYDKINKIIKGTYSFTLVRTYNGKVDRIPVSGKFHTPFTIAQ
jgi:hypothetical protein